MAIRIDKKNMMLGEQYGRITMPKGTYFSNPSTAADGVLGGGGALLPPTPQINPEPVLQPNFFQSLVGYNPNRPPVQTTRYPVAESIGYSVMDAVLKAVGARQLSMRNISGSPDDRMERNRYSGIVKEIKKTEQYGNPLVGEAYPSVIRQDTMRMITPGISWDKQNALLQSKGYEWVPYNGGFWVQTGKPVGQSPDMLTQMAQDARGRPAVNPFELGATLEPGERAVVSGGYGVVGGTPTSTGEAQYAVTMPGQGDRWKFKVQRDSDGNWARIYYRTDGRVNRRSQENRRRKARQDNTSEPTTSEVNQLVTLRASYG